MSTENTPDLTVEQDSDDDLVKTLRQQLREERSGRREAETRAGTLERKDVFRDLGIDTSAGPGKLFFEHYSGELTEEAVKQAASEYSIPVGSTEGQQPGNEGQQTGNEGQQQQTPGTPTPAQPHPDQQHHDELAAARAGAGGGAGLPDDKQRAQEKYEEAINAGRTNDDAMAGYFSERFNAAMEKRSRGA